MTDPKLLFIPSAWSDEYLFQNQIEAFKDRYQIIVPAINHFDTIADAANAIIAQYSPVHMMIGLSLGGLIAIDILTQQPHFADKAILSGTFAHAFSEEERALYRNLIAEVEQGRLSDYTTMFADIVTTDKTKQNAKFMQSIQDMVMRVGAKACMNHHKMALSYHDHTAMLKNIRADTLIIAGRDDNATPIAFHQTLAAAIPNARLAIIEDAAHFCPLEQPETFTRLMQQHLQSSHKMK